MGGRSLTMAELDAKAQELGTIGAAMQWARQNGYSLDTDTELPPFRGQQPVYTQGQGAPSPKPATSGTLARIAAPQGQSNMDETQDEETGGLGGGALSEDYLKDYAAQATQLAKDEAEFRRKQLEEGTARINQLYAGPSASARLWALSKAFLSPKPYRGIAGTLANVSGAMSGLNEQREVAETKRAEALAQLQQSYGGTALQARRAQLDTDLDIAKARAAMNKPVRPRTGFNPVTGELVDLDTNTPITPPPPRVGEVRKGYRYLGGDPASPKSWSKV